MADPVNERGVLILAGGRGERFWPWSTPERPKQLLPLASGGRSLLAATFARARRVVPAGRIVVITSEALVAACEAACPGAIVVGEPVQRNTAPAIAAAAAFFAPGDPFAVLPSDAAIDDEDAFARDLDAALTRAERDGVLVTFGIRPTHSATGFGYIRRGALLAPRVHRVAQFTEKPDAERAAAWIATGEYAWNSGMFVWTRRAFEGALQAGRPAIAAALAGLTFGAGDARAFERVLRERFPAIESVSVDYAVLETAPNVVVIEASFDWDDLGSWTAWARRQARDAQGNVTFGDAVLLDCERCVVVSEGGVAAAMGLRDTLVVRTAAGTLACPLDQVEHMRRLSEAVRARQGA